jgi:hypothetical protein
MGETNPPRSGRPPAVYPQRPIDDKLDTPSIEVEIAGGYPDEFTVQAYDEGRRWARSFSDYSLGFHGLAWTRGAPPVEQLSCDWQEVRNSRYVELTGGWKNVHETSRFRISDPDAYVAQMWRLLRLA